MQLCPSILYAHPKTKEKSMVGEKRNEDPVEGSRETVERELERHKNNGTKTPDRSTGSKEERIRRRAYEIWDREGRPDGEHERHWQQAEKELEGEEGAGKSGDR
jgi:galactose-1-phosphate uridylyltransferase